MIYISRKTSERQTASSQNADRNTDSKGRLFVELQRSDLLAGDSFQYCNDTGIDGELSFNCLEGNVTAIIKLKKLFGLEFSPRPHPRLSHAFLVTELGAVR